MTATQTYDMLLTNKQTLAEWERELSTSFDARNGLAHIELEIEELKRIREENDKVIFSSLSHCYCGCGCNRRHSNPTSGYCRACEDGMCGE